MEGPCPQERFMATSSVTNCCICESAFGLMRWKYNCHYCGRVVCADCSLSTMFLPPVWVNAPVRVCATCVPIAKDRGGYFEGRSLGTSARAGEDEPAEAMRAKMAAARLPSQQQQRPGLVDPEKRALLDQISKILIEKGKKEPAGLRNMDNAKLQTYLDYLMGNTMPPPPTTTTTMTSAAPAEVRPRQEEAAPAQPPPARHTSDPIENPMLAAAMRRKAEADARSGGTAPVDPEKQAIIFQITKILKEKGKEEPFGLRSMDKVKLQSYLRHLRGE